MSDTGRQSLTDKASASMKPDSQKGMLEQAGDKMKSTMDSGAGAMQSNKSTSQRVSDSLTGNDVDNRQDSMLDKAKNAVGMGNNNNN